LEDRVPEEGARFFGVGDRRFFEEDVFAGFQSFQSPRIVQTVWQGDVDTVYGWIIDECYDISVLAL
jgi:hypothetical protein